MSHLGVPVKKTILFFDKCCTPRALGWVSEGWLGRPEVGAQLGPADTEQTWDSECRFPPEPSTSQRHKPSQLLGQTQHNAVFLCCLVLSEAASMGRTQHFEAARLGVVDLGALDDDGMRRQIHAPGQRGSAAQHLHRFSSLKYCTSQKPPPPLPPPGKYSLNKKPFVSWQRSTAPARRRCSVGMQLPVLPYSHTCCS